MVSSIVEADGDIHWSKIFAAEGTKQEDGHWTPGQSILVLVFFCNYIRTEDTSQAENLVFTCSYRTN